MSAGDMNKKWRSVAAKYAAKGDQDLQEFRESYLRWSTNDRIRFKAALVLINEANDILGKLPASFFRSHIETQWDTRDDEGNIVGGNSATLPARLILKAIAAWDAGLEFAPPGMDFLA